MEALSSLDGTGAKAWSIRFAFFCVTGRSVPTAIFEALNLFVQSPELTMLDSNYFYLEFMSCSISRMWLRRCGVCAVSRDR